MGVSNKRRGWETLSIHGNLPVPYPKNKNAVVKWRIKVIDRLRHARVSFERDSWKRDPNSICKTIIAIKEQFACEP